MQRKTSTTDLRQPDVWPEKSRLSQEEPRASDLAERAIGLKVDVSNAESMEAMVCGTVEHFGGLDIFVSNAGVLKAGSLEVMETKDFEFVTKVNYIGYFNAAVWRVPRTTAPMRAASSAASA